MHPRKIDRYQYITKTPAWLLRSVYSFGVLSWILVLIGYSSIVRADSFYKWTIGPIIVYFTAYYSLSYAINFFYTQLDLKEHKKFIRNFWKKNRTCASIDIFLPICGEDVDVLRKTFRAVSNLEHPNFRVYVLDDKGLEDHKQLSEEYGFTYFCRENKGFMKKAGNIKYAYERSSGDFVVIYDADFAPHPRFIKELLPYMIDEKIGIIQSPQYFQVDKSVHKRSKLEYGGANVQEDFYRFIQVARDHFGVPICCGSNAIYRRTALDSIGGTTQIEHSEDMYTGFNMTLAGFRVKYLPIILAVGLCPDNLHAYFHQQHRWCSGSLGLMLDKKFWKSKLTVSQKLCFISGFMYYMSYPVIILLSFNSFLILLRYKDFVNVQTSLLFLPCVAFSFVVMPLFRISQEKFGNFYAKTAFSYSYCHAVMSAFFKGTDGWQPTNAKKVTVSKAYKQVLYFLTGYSLIYFTLICVTIREGVFFRLNVDYYFIIFWIILNIFSITMILSQFYLTMNHIKYKEVENGTIRPTALGIWQLKTAGVYLFCVIGIFLSIVVV